MFNFRNILYYVIVCHVGPMKYLFYFTATSSCTSQLVLYTLNGGSPSYNYPQNSEITPPAIRERGIERERERATVT